MLLAWGVLLLVALPFLPAFRPAVASAMAAAGTAVPLPEPVTPHLPDPQMLSPEGMLVAIALATLVSEDLACIGAGVLVAEGHISFLLAAFSCFLGIVVGDVMLFAAGRWLGRAVVQRAPLRWFIQPETLVWASKWLERNGATVISISRLTPGTRLPTYLAAGLLHTPFRKFLLYFLMAAAIWTPLIVGVSAGLGGPFMHHPFLEHQPLWLKLLVGGVLLLTVTRFVTALVTYRGRRGLARRWKRFTRWEFWPPYVFYPPVFLYVAYLGLRFRDFTLFTAANPAITAGGFIGESKFAILSQLREAAAWLPAFELIPPGSREARIAHAEELLRSGRFHYPVVLKPDAGQRGSGVAVVRTADDVRSYFARATYPVILQEYVPGKEFGVFYYRYPNEACGRIFSITEKAMPVLTGDGRRTLEELILDDDRAVCMSDFYIRKNAERSEQVPAAGERVQLVELGTHCRGAIFLDGGATLTPELEALFDHIAQTFDGFFFGRFDVRVPSATDFSQGKHVKVIELNGVTSEATHIYDPKLSIWQAYGVLWHQWRVAFEIGAQNRARGVKSTGTWALLRMIQHYRQQAREHPE